MDNLAKISDVTERYGISTRTLRYYEDIGLLNSVRPDDYAYRMYDAENLSRIEQILVLRKLNIAIKDIQRIFATDSASAVLEVLTKKARDIDTEAAWLHELKKIVLAFIREIEASDLSSREAIVHLYQRASEIARTIAQEGDEDADGPAPSLDEVSENTRRLVPVRVVTLPGRRVAAYTGAYEAVDQTVRALGEAFYPARYQWFNPLRCDVESFIALPEGFAAPEGVATQAFAAGAYAVGMVQGDTRWGIETDLSLIYRWVNENGFALRKDAFLIWSDLPAVGSQPPLIEVYVPVAEAADAEKLPDTGAAARLPPLPRVLRTHAIDLTDMIVDPPAVVRHEGGEAHIINHDGDDGGLVTREAYSLPLRIRLRAKTDSTNIRVNYGKGGLVFNWGMAVDSLIGRAIADGSFFHHEPGGYIPINEYAEIEWILTKDYMAVLVDGAVRMVKTDAPFLAQDGMPPCPVVLSAAFRSVMTVDRLAVDELEG